MQVNGLEHPVLPEHPGRDRTDGSSLLRSFRSTGETTDIDQYMNPKEFNSTPRQGTGFHRMVKISGVALSALALGAHAQTYQSAWSSASVNEIYTERTDNLYGNGLMLSGTHYFSPVKMDYSQPFDEQAWLQKVNQIYASYTPYIINQNDVAHARQERGKIGTKIYSGTVVSEIEFETQVSSSTFNQFTPLRLVGKSVEAQRVSLGYFVGPRATVSVVRASSKSTTNTNFSYTGSYYEALTSTSVGFHGAVQLSHSSSLVLDGSLGTSNYSTTTNQTNFQQELGLKYYPVNTIYFGLAIKKDAGEDKTSERRITRVSSGFMLNPRLNIQLGITKSVGDGYNYNNHQINTVGAEYRL
jgi:hypothetical protein